MPRVALDVLPGGAPPEPDLRELYVKYGGAVFGRCRLLLKDTPAAEDAMQDVFVRALGHWSEFRAQASRATWLMTIATHHCLNLLRKRSASGRAHSEFMLTRRAAQDGSPRLEARELVSWALSQCNSEIQAVVVHYYVDEMTLEEVAAVVGRSVPTIRKRLAEFSVAVGQELQP